MRVDDRGRLRGRFPGPDSTVAAEVATTTSESSRAEKLAGRAEGATADVPVRADRVAAPWRFDGTLRAAISSRATKAPAARRPTDCGCGTKIASPPRLTPSSPILTDAAEQAELWLSIVRRAVVRRADAGADADDAVVCGDGPRSDLRTVTVPIDWLDRHDPYLAALFREAAKARGSVARVAAGRRTVTTRSNEP